MSNYYGHIIILEGLPGVGKTVLATSIASANPNAICMKEWVDDQVLKDYIADMKNKATDFQFHIQEETMERLNKAVNLAKEGKTVIIDRGLMGNRCFAEVQYELGLISEESIISYRSKFTYDNVKDFNEVDTQVIYMQSSAEFCLRRISKRNRNGEDSYTLEYLKNLKTKHDKFLLRAKFLQSDHDHQLTDQGFIPEQTLDKLITV